MSNQPSNEKNDSQSGNSEHPMNPPQEGQQTGDHPNKPEVDKKLTSGQKRLIITVAIVGGAVILIPLLLFGACFLLISGF